jgi:hypothetical protein
VRKLRENFEDVIKCSFSAQTFSWRHNTSSERSERSFNAQSERKFQLTAHLALRRPRFFPAILSAEWALNTTNPHLALIFGTSVPACPPIPETWPMSQDMEVGVSRSHVSGGHVPPTSHAQKNTLIVIRYLGALTQLIPAAGIKRARNTNNNNRPTNDTDDHRTSTSNTATEHENSVASLGFLASICKRKVT